MLLREIEDNPAFTYPIKTYHRADMLYNNPGMAFRFSNIQFASIADVFVILYSVAILGAIVLELPNIVMLLHGWGVLPPR